MRICQTKESNPFCFACFFFGFFFGQMESCIIYTWDQLTAVISPVIPSSTGPWPGGWGLLF